MEKPLEFHAAVLKLSHDEDIGREEAYTRLEKEYMEKNGRRRYASYESFYFCTLDARYREDRKRQIRDQLKNKLFDLAEKHRNRDLSTPDMVKEIVEIVYNFKK